MRSIPTGWDGPIGTPDRGVHWDPISAITAGANILGSFIGADSQRSAGNKAADAQTRAAEMGIDEQRRQFDAIQKILAPFVSGGTTAFGAQGDLIGLGGAAKQQAAITALQGSPAFQAALKQGNSNILANASATGGLRGGNVQAALGQFAPALLGQTINDQYTKLGGLASLGQNAAAGVGNAGIHSGDMVSQLLQQQGAAQAGKYLNQGAANSQMFGGFFGGLGNLLGGRLGLGGSGFTGDPGHTSVDWGF